MSQRIAGQSRVTAGGIADARPGKGDFPRGGPGRWGEHLLRAGCDTRRDLYLDGLWLLALGLLLIATGIGLRDPWPADEPRFALVARDMVASGQWLVPRVGGDIYGDKPPLFFWLITLGMEATHSLRIAFLLPSLLAGLGTVALVYDLGRRLWNREAGLAAGVALLLTVQFVWQARQAQIDATLCFFTTLGLYGLLRHLLLGPKWGWYAIGWAAAGFGVITKGVGFLPLLALIPFALLRSPRWSPRLRGRPSAMWLIGPMAFIAAVCVWLAPMLLAAHADPALASYRDEILFRQTVQRYTDAWHHQEPFYYFLVSVIPWLWLPLTLLLPWLLPRWRTALCAFDLRIALLLSWVVLVVLFFSLSTGKRGVYILPAVPALTLACAPYLVELARRRAVQRVMFGLAAFIGVICAAGVAYLLLEPQSRLDVVSRYEIDPLGPLSTIALAIAVAIALAWAFARSAGGVLAYGATLASALLVVSFWVNPVMNPARSGAAFIATVEEAAGRQGELGIVAFKEQYLLNLTRPIVHFGHARWREAEQEAADAALWLSALPGRQLVVSEAVRSMCFAAARSRSLGMANRTTWYLVEGAADPACVERGNPGAVHIYDPSRP